MKLIQITTALVAVASACGHTIFSTPTPRENTVHTNHGTSECGSGQGNAATYSRGQQIPLEWGRNNHHGGFIQVSVLPKAQVSGNGASAINAFDDPTNIIFGSCYNSGGCKSAFNGNVLGVGGDGTGFQQNMCSTTLNIPTYLPDGDYVMKSIAFGNGDSFGIKSMAHTSYSNCHNFRVAGGAAVTAKPGNNAHIQWKLNDGAITIMNQRTGSNVASSGQCMFLGTNTHMGCKGGGSRAPECSTPLAALTKCALRLRARLALTAKTMPRPKAGIFTHT